MFKTQNNRNSISAVIIVGSLIAFTAGGLVLERWGDFARVRKTVHNRSVPSGLLNYGALGKLMKRLGLVMAVPNDRVLYLPSGEPEPDVNASIFRRKRYVGEYLFEANPGGYGSIPSSGAVGREVLTPGLPVVSVVVPESDLFGKERGIVSNFKESGRLWERLAYVSYFEGSRLVFATAAGIRLHGGSSRGKDRPQSYRLYFREEYGSDQFKPGVLFNAESEPLKHLVVHNILDWQHRFTPVIAFDIARRIGCVTPETKVVRFVLNGRPQGYYYLSEHLNKNQWVPRMGHDNFAFYKFRGRNDRETVSDHRRLERWVADPGVKMTMAEAGKFVDVDNLTRQLFSWMYCNTTDQVQGVAVSDRAVPGSRWYWINWDMDQSFVTGHWRLKDKPHWEQPSIELAAGLNTSWMKQLVRPTLFRRLLEEDPEYRDYFIGLVTDLLNHRLTPGYLETLMDSYSLFPPFPVEGEGYIFEKNRLRRDILSFRRYFKHRSFFMRKELLEYFNLGGVYSCRIDGLPVLGYEVDGYPEEGNYEGYYFKGRTVTVRIVSPPGAVFSHWLVNGEKVPGETLVHAVEGDTVIRPVLTNGDALVEAAAAADPRKRALEWVRANIPGGTVLVVPPEPGLDTGALAGKYTIFMWDYKGLGEETFDMLSAVLGNPYFFVPVVEAYGSDAGVKRDAALLEEFRGRVSPGVEFGTRVLLRNYYYPQGPGVPGFVIGRLGSRDGFGGTAAVPGIWDSHAVSGEVSPALRLFSRRGEVRLDFVEEEGKHSLEARIIAADEKGKRWASFGYEFGRSGLDMAIPVGKYVHLVVSAAVSPGVLNKQNYLLISDIVGGEWEMVKVYFSSPGWRTYIISKRVREGSNRLLAGFRLLPGSGEDVVRVREVKLFISDNPLQESAGEY